MAEVGQYASAHEESITIRIVEMYEKESIGILTDGSLDQVKPGLLLFINPNVNATPPPEPQVQTVEEQLEINHWQITGEKVIGNQRYLILSSGTQAGVREGFQFHVYPPGTNRTYSLKIQNVYPDFSMGTLSGGDKLDISLLKSAEVQWADMDNQRNGLILILGITLTIVTILLLQ